MLTNIWKAYDSSPWQNKFYQWNSKSLIEAHDSNPWRFIQSSTLIGNIKAQFLLATIKTQFSLTLLYQKEKSPRLSTLGREKISCYHSKKGPLQVFMKKPKKEMFTNKSSWEIKTHGNMRTQLSPCE